ncbi:MAG: response regulator [Oscillospiraceae bacterium]|jgi:PAS domain S-box-containing protein|nr:response regulator [Oscillospiraceae bacterium]
MKKIKSRISAYILSDEHPIAVRILNMTYILGIFVSFAAMIMQSIESASSAAIVAIAILPISVVILLVVVNKYKLYAFGNWFIVIAVCMVFMPVTFFTSGGIYSGMPAFFTLSAVVIFLLVRGRGFAVALIVHYALMAACYYTAYKGLIPVEELNGKGMVAMDCFYGALFSSVFIGFFLKFQDRLYKREKLRADDAIRELDSARVSAVAIFEGSPYVSVLFDKDFNLIDCNDAAAEYIGASSREELLAGFGRLAGYIIPERQPGGERSVPLAVRLRTALETGAVSFETELRLKGDARAASIVLKRIPYKSGFAVAGYIIDITDVREAQNAVTRRNNLLSAVNEVAALLLSDSGSEGSIYAGVTEALATLALAIDVDRAFIWRNTEGEDGALLSSQVAAWRRDGEPVPPFDSLPFDKVLHGFERDENGIIRTINAKVSELPPGAVDARATAGMKSFLVTPIVRDREFGGFITFEDFTEERVFSPEDEDIISYGAMLIGAAFRRAELLNGIIRAQREAETASRAKSDFLSNMSHEMRTPMNAIIGMTAIGKMSSDIERKDYAFGKIEDASTHLLGVINDILDMSKIEANKFELSPESFNFEKMLQKVVNVINFRVDEKRQSLTVHIDKNIPRVLIGDDQRLAQVLTNLLSNAVKFTPEDGRVSVSARLLGEEDGLCTLQIEVKDTGIGISPEQQTRLFRSFQQAESSTSRKFGGTGLGLAISKRIVEMMGGEIWAESTLGEGSVFAFTIRAERGAAGKQQSLLGPGVDWKTMRLLAVDDAPEILDYFTEIMRGFGVSCDVASGGKEACGLIESRGAYDIYFVDWRMPDMDGLELARRINGSGEEGRSVVIMMSSAEWSAIEDEAKAAGVKKFLPKPLFPSEIADCINECMGVGGTADLSGGADGGAADDFTGRRILLAEDVEINREILIALLEPTGIEIDCAENGALALEKFSASPDAYDMIFMDVQMPEMDGYEATRGIRALKNPKAATIPVVAMTANVFREDVEKCLAAGMNDHVGKPLDLEEVLDRLREYLPKRQPPREKISKK